MQQHLCPPVSDRPSTFGDYSADVIVGAEKRLQRLCIISTCEIGARIRKITTRVDDVRGSTVGQQKCVQHLCPEYSPISFHVFAHRNNRVSNNGAFHTVVWEYFTASELEWLVLLKVARVSYLWRKVVTSEPRKIGAP